MRCPRSGLSAHPAETRLDIRGFLGPQAQRVGGLATATWSCNVAAEPTRYRNAHPRRVDFAAAEGDVAFVTDGVVASSHGGWRELKLARFQARPRSEAAGVVDRTSRVLHPTASGAGTTTAS